MKAEDKREVTICVTYCVGVSQQAVILQSLCDADASIVLVDGKQ